MQYFGVYAPPPPLALLTGEAGKTQEQLSYKIVRPSQVTAQLIGPDGKPRVLEAGVQHVPGSYSFTYSTFDVEGTWHWNVTATDDLKRVSTIDRAFRYDTTLRGLSVPRPARGERSDPVHPVAPCEREVARRDTRRRARSPGAAREPAGRSAGRRLGRTLATRQPCVRRELRRSPLRHELGRNVRVLRTVLLQAHWLESRRVTSLLAHYGVHRRVLPHDDRRGVPGGERVGDGLRRRARLGCVDARVRRARLARDRLSRRTWPSCSPVCSGIRSVRSAGGALGERGGEPFVVRHGRWFHLSAAKFERAQQWFARWNDWAVFVGRVTPVARSFVSIPAGVFGSPFRRYNVLTLRR